MGNWFNNCFEKNINIPDGTIILPGKFLTFTYESIWFTDSSESVELRDADGTLVDKTPNITDLKNDFFILAKNL